jgi:hypothetical protein
MLFKYFSALFIFNEILKINNICRYAVQRLHCSLTLSTVGYETMQFRSSFINRLMFVINEHQDE